MCSRGLKQGDSCSPILFSLLINELANEIVLNKYIKKELRGGLSVKENGSVWLHEESLCLGVIQFQFVLFVLCHPGLHVRDACLLGQDIGVYLQNIVCRQNEFQSKSWEVQNREWREEDQELSPVGHQKPAGLELWPVTVTVWVPAVR